MTEVAKRGLVQAVVVAVLVDESAIAVAKAAANAWVVTIDIVVLGAVIVVVKAVMVEGGVTGLQVAVVGEVVVTVGEVVTTVLVAFGVLTDHA